MRLELTRRTDYAIRAALILARNPGARLSTTEISRRTHTPARFAGQVMSDLVRAGIVTAVVGRAGGYTLNDAPESISVLRIVEAVEGDARRQHCSLRGGPCRGDQPCEVHFVFSGAQEAFIDKLAGTSLAELAVRQPERASSLREGVTRKASVASPGTPRPALDAEG